LSQLIQTSLGPLSVTRIGDGPRTAVLWHSLFLDSRSWEPILASLRKDRALVLIDGPGHGASPGPRRRYTLDDCADAAVEILGRLELPEVDWIGNAWGGHVGAVLAARPGSKLRTLAVIGSPMQPLRIAERVRIGALVQIFRAVGFRPWLLRAITDALLLPGTVAQRPELRSYVEQAAQAQGRAALLTAMRSVMLGRPSLLGILSSIKVPCLFVTTDGDPLWTPEVARLEMARIAGGRLEIIPGSRHIPSLENPAALAAVLSKWLAAREA